MSALTNLPAEVQAKAEAEAARQALYEYLNADEGSKAAAQSKAAEQLKKSISTALEAEGLDAGTRQRLEGILDNIDSEGEIGDNKNDLLHDTLNKTEELDPVKSAKNSQGDETYTGIDNWIPSKLNKGEIYYRGEPNGTNFFTTKESIESVNENKNKLFEGLQVRKDPKHGYRQEMRGYLLKSDIDAATASCLENTQFGKGGLEQKYIPNANDLIKKGILVPIEIITLKG